MSQQNFNVIIIIVLIVIIIYFIIKGKNEKFETLDPSSNYETIRDLKIPGYYKDEECNFKEKINKSEFKKFPLEKHVERDYIIDKLLEKGPKRPGLPEQTVKQFNDDFFKFRDFTYADSNALRPDPVDTINSMKLSGVWGDEFRSFPNAKIWNIYDSMVSGVNLYKDPQYRPIKYDNIMYDGWEMNYGGTGLELTRENWEYPNENKMNGGELAPGLMPNDNSAQMQTPVFGIE